MSNIPEESSLEFDWHDSKRQAALKKHRIDFRDAVRIFNGPVLIVPSRYPAETRWVAVGIVDAREIVVVYTVRDGRRRIITARRARKHERREYYAYVAGGGEPP